MALTRKMLKGMGIEEEKIDLIIDAHIEVTDALKNDVKKYRDDAEKLPGVQKELDDLKAKGEDGYKDKYEKEHSAFEAYKSEITKKETYAANEAAYRSLLKDAGIKDKYIDTIVRAERSVIENIKLTDGKIDDEKSYVDSAKSNWADFVVTTTTKPAGVETPPANNGGKTGKTKEEIMAIRDPAVRQAEIAKNPEAFGLKFD